MKVDFRKRRSNLALRLVMDTTDKIKIHPELDIVIPHIDVNAEYTKANVMDYSKNYNKEREVVRYVFENTGIMLYAYLRGEERHFEVSFRKYRH